MATRKDALTIPRLAELAGVGQTTWKAHRAAGAPAPKSDRRADLKAWIEAYAAWREERGKVASTERSTGNTAATAEMQRWAGTRMKMLAMTAQVRLGREMRKLIPREDVMEFARRAALACRGRLNELVEFTAKLRAAPDDEAAKDLMRAEVDSICGQFARGMEPPEIQDATDDEGDEAPQ